MKRALLLPPASLLICHLTADIDPFRIKPSTAHLNKKTFLCHRKSVQAPQWPARWQQIPEVHRSAFFSGWPVLPMDQEVIQSLHGKWMASTSDTKSKQSKGQQPRTFSLKLSKVQYYFLITETLSEVIKQSKDWLPEVQSYPHWKQQKLHLAQWLHTDSYCLPFYPLNSSEQEIQNIF